MKVVYQKPARVLFESLEPGDVFMYISAAGPVVMMKVDPSVTGSDGNAVILETGRLRCRGPRCEVFPLPDAVLRTSGEEVE